MRLAAALVCIVTHIGTVNANVEKTVFLGPSPVTLQHVRPGLDDLGLQVLTPSDTVLSTRLRLQFPTHSLPRGLESWYLLRQLDGARRYEVRICWPATQPTDFWLETFPPAHVFATPELVSSLAQYSEQRQAHVNADGQDFKGVASEAPESVLFLRLQAAASYYSTNRTLMDDPPAVDADIILDPFVLNVFPHSLGPIAIYITAVAVGAYFLSAYIYRWLLLALAADPPSKPHTD